jgi:membrane protease YdiL (CAAX protease family)
MHQRKSRPLCLGPDVASRSRWWASSLLGTTLGLAAIIASYLLAGITLSRVEGLGYALVGIAQALLVPLAVWIGLKPVSLSLRHIGLRGPQIARDAALGLTVAVVFAILQFMILIPATGGAARDDIVTNVAQIGDGVDGVVGFIVLAWTGGLAEELLFRGHLLTSLRNALGESTSALTVASVTTVVVFAALHGYQGWAGVLDTGLYGGVILTLLFILTEGRLTACFVAHAGWNTLATIGLYLWYGTP